MQRFTCGGKGGYAKVCIPSRRRQGTSNKYKTVENRANTMEAPRVLPQCYDSGTTLFPWCYEDLIYHSVFMALLAEFSHRRSPAIQQCKHPRVGEFVSIWIAQPLPTSL